MSESEEVNVLEGNVVGVKARVRMQEESAGEVF